MPSGTFSLKALIVDDEPPARKRLRKLLQPFVSEGRVKVLGEAGDGVEALDMLRSSEVDLAFLDIQMPELDGFGVLERLTPEQRPIVIFTTAYDSYALRAFEANAIDYLLKPVSKDRLEDALERAVRIKGAGQIRGVDHEKLDRLLDWIDAQSAATEPAQTGEYLRQLSVPYRDRILLIPIDQVVSAEINEGITRVFVLDADQKPRVRQHVVNYTLDQLESMLPPQRFMRVHRSAIVHLDHVLALVPWFSGRYKLILEGEHQVIASRERSKQLKDTLMI